jgi:predicted  nucleic acid-binding Zn-ribbon protein
MSRMDDVLKEHQAKLREELSAAYKKRADLSAELLHIEQQIATAELDLVEVATEVTNRAKAFQKAQHFIIAEGLYD